MNGDDITQQVIKTDDIRQRVSAFFPDSVILDNQFRFLAISQNILDALDYKLSDLYEQSINILSQNVDLRSLVEQRLKAGYFEQEKFKIRAKNSRMVGFSVSGFYFGLIADVNGLIVLKCKNNDEINLIHEKLELKTAELDAFVYKSSHALRGPLATIKGLANLARITKNPKEVEFLIQQIDLFADKLDDKLHRLIVFAETDKGSEHESGPVSLYSICEKLSAVPSEASVDFPVNFQFELQDKAVVIENGEIIMSLLKNVLQFFSRQPKSPINRITFDSLKSLSATEFIFRGRGFTISDDVIDKLKTLNFGYSEILDHPEFIDCYAAKKIVMKLRGNVQFHLDPSRELVVLITLPTA
jgi:signal transduction histidine kinase